MQKACSEYHYSSLLTTLMARPCHIPHKIRKWDCTPITPLFWEPATPLITEKSNVGNLIYFVLYKSIMLVVSWITRSMLTQTVAQTHTSRIRRKNNWPFPVSGNSPSTETARHQKPFQTRIQLLTYFKVCLGLNKSKNSQMKHLHMS